MKEGDSGIRLVVRDHVIGACDEALENAVLVMAWGCPPGGRAQQIQPFRHVPLELPTGLRDQIQAHEPVDIVDKGDTVSPLSFAAGR